MQDLPGFGGVGVMTFGVVSFGVVSFGAVVLGGGVVIWSRNVGIVRI